MDSPIWPQYLKLPERGFFTWGELRPSAATGLHVVLGKNNSGKTRLLEALRDSQFEAELAPAAAVGGGVLEHWDRLRVSHRHGEAIPNIRLTWPRQPPQSPPGSERWESTKVAFARPPTLLPLQTVLAQNTQAIQTHVWQRLLRRGAVLVGTNRHFRTLADISGGLGVEEDDLENLAAHFETTRQNIETHQLAEAITDAFAEITEGTTIRTFNDNAAVVQRRRFYVQEPKGPRVPLDVAGDGLRDLFFLIRKAILHPFEDLLLDEPGLRLHPHAQRRLLHFLKSKATHRAVWIATHDPVFIGSSAIVSRLSVRREEGKSLVRAIGASDGPDEYASLGWIPGDAFLAERVVYCEGPSDALAFEAVIRGMEANDPNLGGSVVEAIGGDGAAAKRSGSSQLLRTVRLMRKVAPYAKHVVILDRAREDQERRALKKTLADEGVHLHVLERTELEDYFLSPGLVFSVVALAAQTYDVATPDRAAVDAALETATRDNAQGSRILDAVWQRCLSCSYRKTDGAKFAMEVLRGASVGDGASLREEVSGALSGVQRG
jgi:hypothetical protein